MSEPQKKKELSSEMRILIASILSMAVILLWAKFFAPKPPANLPQTNRPAITTPVGTTPAAASSSSAPSTSASKSNAQTPAGIATGIAPSNAAAMPPKADAAERTIVVENALYRVEISNRGGVVKSWQLKKYMDDSKPQRVLDVVHPEAAAQVGGWPFAVVLDDPQLEAQANSALFVAGVAEPSAHAGDAAANYEGLPANPLQAPSQLKFVWSDGHLEVTKIFQFDHSYVVRVETAVKFNGTPIKAGLAWLGGFGDPTVQNPVPVDTTFTFYNEGGKLTDLPYKKLEGPEKWGPGVWMGGKDFAGIEDRYFAAAFLPANGVASGSVETRYWKVMRTVQKDGKDEQEPVSEVAAATSSQPLALRVYVGPKDYDDLKAMKPPLQSLVNFGFLEFIAEPLFHGMKWLHKYIPNWGWTIVVLTLVINMLLFPLRISSYKTTLKMQRVAPEIKAIQERYKKYKLNDPKKQEMNKEVMAIYSREGINPVGGCFQMFLQMPIWFGLNSALRGSIELRHAHWLWISDLASKDPYYVLPVVVGVSMYLVSKMTPMTTADPQQAQMMKIMPIMFAGSFIIFPFSSGLALYILTSSLVGIGQQWYLNRTHPAPAAAKQISRGKK
ncbi:MAG TPA: membrane protein insertase YidC [Candidatus Acidoferrum sp.]|nr:membrane protein insertase YidC [Candidatus Acidoferrum sp.]